MDQSSKSTPYQHKSVQNDEIFAPHGDFLWLIGRDSVCDIRVDSQNLEPKHAQLKRESNRVFLRDMGSNLGTTINDERIEPRKWMEISRYDTVKLGNKSLAIHPQVFFGGGLAGLDSTRLEYRARDTGVVLCDGAYIRAEPGTLTAIMGPAGSGKSVFINLLNGYNRPDKGKVFVGKQFDVHGSYGSRAVRDYIGYLPQAEIMIPELSVYSSIYYRLKLRYPNIRKSFCERFIRQICLRLGFDKKRLEVFLDKKIGSPGSRGEVLSGGERRRANIAHELACRTQILIMDEPTSGLSSVEAEQIIDLLRRLAKEDGLTVITSVHQPSREVFEKFDYLLLMSYGGQPAFYGETKFATMVMERLTGTLCGKQNPAVYVLNVLKDSANREQLTGKFRQDKPDTTFIAQPLSMNDSEIVVDTMRVHKRSSEACTSLLKYPFSWYKETKTLLKRNLKVTFSEIGYPLFLFGQVPLIALLVFLAFHNMMMDNRDYDTFARTYNLFGEALRTWERSDAGGFPAESAFRKALHNADNPDELIKISEPASKQRASVIFTLIVASIWFGVMGACKEIVTEQDLIRRESRSCMRLGPYISAKMSVQIFITAIQTALLIAIVVPVILHMSFENTIRLWLVLWLSAATAASLGLLVSSVSRTYRVALTAVPLLVIPQLLFGGLIRPLEAAGNSTRWPELTSYLTIQRWGFQAALDIESNSNQIVLRQSIDMNPEGKLPYFKYIKFQEAKLKNIIFGESTTKQYLHPVIILISASLVMLLMCRIILYIRLLR
ncbi:ATP-binding cassette domain-containing protein [bacterium]|nr:ATP-binding cassette domain-containing protein [candidate division CSSED10-310 bacterium]